MYHNNKQGWNRLETELTIVVPTYNERDNIKPMLDALNASLQDLLWEIVFVDDDSSDKTAELVREIAKKDARVRCIQRINRRGLSSACIEGILSSASPYIAVIDADMQHDESLLPAMLNTLKTGNLDLVIGSRYITGGGTGQLSKHRVWVSRTATLLSGLALRQQVHDPMSGYFMLRRSFFEKVMRKLSGKGFKILLDILVTAGPSVKFRELPYVMRQRTQGESKLSFIVIWEFITLVVYKLIGRILPARFISFATVGFSGIFVHLCALWFFYRFLDIEFIYAQASATLIAMTSNYILNNYFTYPDRKLKGVAFVRGLLSFYLACTLGAIINVAVADLLFGKSFPWWLAGTLGAVAGAVWNYAATATFTWRINGDKSR
ncbi:MAG: dolichol monophosphate mannose synthase [Gammaproteobacteria bacterium RIFCSPLOWO2_01_FULL_47_190]|nr:MAG: dolichol monophosphate mannose synthase [Gammaproteobacteria bacterium RIFCSPLOWO2_01_FULL_47_190]OGT76970.1 MAG: dolichol monophosphate mannose synthase [Gammaproteobacteria bacterium RIFCSPLOWO2_12_47_11]OGT83008.1 MAG: dolichol monophosphate mannose synthase [Gammaproteobacteria bacterium RIFCSPLOWO2_12_FULL_47_76]